MAKSTILTTTTLLLALTTVNIHAHFVLNYPPSIGFSDDDESTAVCGNFAPDFGKNNVTDFHVGGDVVAARTVHPQTTYLVRALLGESLSTDSSKPNSFTTLAGPIRQTSIGDLCLPDIVVPSNWTGQSGIINVVADGPDGLLYQCAAVKFVEGVREKGEGVGACTNSSGISVAAVQDNTLMGASSVNEVKGGGGGDEKSAAAKGSSSMAWSAGVAMVLVFLGSQIL